MSILDELSISRKQARSIALANADASQSQMNLWHGAVRSGKTVGSLVKFLMKMADGADLTGESVVIGRTRDTVYRNLIAPLQDPKIYGPWAEHVRYNRGAPTADIFGQEVHVIGASDVRSEAVIRGMTIKRSYCDEISLMAEDFVNMLVSRHSVEGAWLGATTNPDGPKHPLKVNYIDRADEMGHRIFHFELEDNRRFLPDGYIENLSRQYTGLWHDRFIKGLWTMADGVIYECFDPAQHVVDKLPDMQRILCVGIDYGTTNPTRGIKLGLGVDNRLYAMAEWAPAQGTTAELERSLRTFCDTDVPDYLFVDPSAAPLKLQLNRDGWTNYANGSNKVSAGIGLVNALLSTDQLLIHHSCTELLGEIPGYVWDTKAAEKGEDAPVKLNDHAVDALRYAVATSRPMWQPHLPTIDAAKRLPDERIEVAA
ncbi:PBSX family phage terminase large subunit [Promicromonospora sukumoe]